MGFCWRGATLLLVASFYQMVKLHYSNDSCETGLYKKLLWREWRNRLCIFHYMLYEGQHIGHTSI
jgi:hypothetical protein